MKKPQRQKEHAPTISNTNIAKDLCSILIRDDSVKIRLTARNSPHLVQEIQVPDVEFAKDSESGYN